MFCFRGMLVLKLHFEVSFAGRDGFGEMFFN